MGGQFCACWDRLDIKVFVLCSMADLEAYVAVFCLRRAVLVLATRSVREHGDAMSAEALDTAIKLLGLAALRQHGYLPSQLRIKK